MRRQDQLRHAIEQRNQQVMQKIVQSFVHSPPSSSHGPLLQTLLGLCVRLPERLATQWLPILVRQGGKLNRPVLEEEGKTVYAPFVLFHSSERPPSEKLYILETMQGLGLKGIWMVDNGGTSNTPWCRHVGPMQLGELPVDTHDIPLGNILEVIRKRHFSLLEYILDQNPSLLQTGHKACDPSMVMLRLLRDVHPGNQVVVWSRVVEKILSGNKKKRTLPKPFVSSYFNKFLGLQVPLSLYSHLIRWLPPSQRLSLLKDELLFLQEERQREHVQGVIQFLKNMENAKRLRRQWQQQENPDKAQQLLWRRIMDQDDATLSKAHRIMKQRQTQTGQFYRGLRDMPEEVLRELQMYN